MFTKSDLQGIRVHVSNASYEIFFHSSIMTDTASAIVRQGGTGAMFVGAQKNSPKRKEGERENERII